MTGDGRQRFLRSIAEHIDADRVEEVHLFPAIRQGGRESGVAVITLHPELPEAEELQGEEDDGIEMGAGDAAVAGDAVDVVDELGVGEGGVDGGADEALVADDAAGTSGVAAAAPAPGDAVASDDAIQPLHRFVVLRANYRLTLKGPNRGKWEVGVVEEADAPAATIAEVVRGVQKRSGDWAGGGVGDNDGGQAPERLTGDGFRAALAEEPWTRKR